MNYQGGKEGEEAEKEFKKQGIDPEYEAMVADRDIKEKELEEKLREVKEYLENLREPE